MNLTQELFPQLKDGELFVSILENLNSGIALIDENGRFILYNKKFLSLFGLDEESTVKNVNDQDWGKWQVFNENLEILHVDDHPVRKAAITGKSVRNQLVGVKLPSGGDITWMLISAIPIFNEKGKIEKTICNYLDVTEHKLADAALRESEQRYRQLFDSMTEMFQVIELVHNENGKAVDYIYRDVNPAFASLVGKPREELLNKRIKDVFKDVRDSWFESYEYVYRTGNSTRFESSGDILNRHFEIIAWKTLEDNVAVILRDITQTKMQEKNLRELNATKDKLFSIISHDLKAPFTSIIGFSDLLIDNIKNNNLNAISEYAGIIKESSWRAMDLLTNLIEWSRLQTGRLEFKPEEVDLVAIIIKVAELLNASAMQKSIEITLNLPMQLNVTADKYMISTAIRNLISNAIKFTKPGGRISVSAFQNDHKLIVEVEDNGIGMEKEVAARLFDSESVITIPGTKNEIGTGLGLALCKDFISKHDGEICVETEPGKGSKFIFTLPVNR